MKQIISNNHVNHLLSVLSISLKTYQITSQIDVLMRNKQLISFYFSFSVLFEQTCVMSLPVK